MPSCVVDAVEVETSSGPSPELAADVPAGLPTNVASGLGSGLSTDALESELVGLAGHLAAGHCRWLGLLAEFDDREGWAGPGLRSCAHWLSWRVGMNLRTGFEQVRVAHALLGLSAIRTAFAAGRISYSKVRAITRIATPATEAPLLELALAGTASHVERVVRHARQAQADPATAEARRHLHWEWEHDGTLRLRATLTAEQGAQLLAALSAVTDRVDCSAEQSDPDASIEPLAARRADALVVLATGTGTGTAEQQLVVHLEHLDPDQPTATIQGGPAIPMATAERLVCGARVRALVKDRRGNPLYLGRTRRLASKTVLAALGMRDQHRCRFPGCEQTRWLRAHHLRSWSLGGPTDIDNLVLLCGRHHRLVHEHGYRVGGSGNDLQFHRPDGRPIPVAGSPTAGDADTLLRQHSDPGIDDSTITPTWAGERLDVDSVIAALLPQPEGGPEDRQA